MNKALRLIKISAPRIGAVFALLLVLMGANRAVACHLTAADISVTYIGPNVDGCSGTTEYKYRVEVTTYYACQTCQGNGAQQSSVQYASASAQADGLTGASGSFQIFDSLAVADTVHQLCGAYADSNSCKTNLATANRFPGFRVRRRAGIITLPYARTDWRFWWSEGARNNSNLTGCGSLYVEAGLDNMTKYNNSTIKFLSNPLPYICVSQPTTYLNGPYDINGDSISVVAHTPYTGPNNPCAYTPPSSVQNQIASTTGFQLNSTTGTVNFTPSATGQYVLAFRGDDYLRGTTTRLSYVYRDVQVSVLPCNAPPPIIDSTKQAVTTISNGTIISTKGLGDAVLVCPGSNLSFSLNSKSNNPASNVYMYANTSLIPGSSFTTTGQGTANVTGTFSWVPTQSHLGEHTLIVESKDSTCLASQPIVLTNYRVIVIKVLNGLNAGPDLATCEINPVPTQLVVYGAEDLKIRWTQDGGPATSLNNDTIPAPLAVVTANTDFVVSTPDLAGTCKASDTVRLFADETNRVEITPKNAQNPENALVMCQPGYLQLEALMIGRPPKNNVACGIGSPTLCNKQDSALVYGSPVYGDNAYDTISAITPILYNTLRTSRMEYLIRRSEMGAAGIISSTLRGMSFTISGDSLTNYIYGNFRIQIKCTEKDQLSEVDGFENTAFTQIYSTPSISFPTAGDYFFPFSTPYNWDTTKNIIIQLCYSDNPTIDTNCGITTEPAILNYVATTYPSGLLLKGGTPADITVCGVDKSPSIQAILGRPSFRFRYCEADPLDFVVTWNHGEYLSDSTIEQPLAYVPKSTSFVVEIKGRSNCIMRDTLNVYIPEHDMSIQPEDTSLCLGDKAPFVVFGGHYFKWYEYENGQFITPGSVDEPTKGYTFIGPKRTTEYRVVVSDSVWCYDTLAMRIKILPLPDVRILNEDDTLVKYGQSFQLLASGARMYNWSPVSSLNNPNISYPIARPTEDTKYIVGGLAANGCRAFDTLHVIVDKRDNLFVPSAFSPNGDGKNDIFKVTNLSFQRIMEFRV
ncbi:MAG TPA: hypothetical protein VIN07_01365, partial [Flavipsychrobacter sp.]